MNMNFDLVVFASLRRGRRASLGVGVGRGDERERDEDRQWRERPPYPSIPCVS